nr:hypothetical protein KRP22_9491 [Phytophthora ramorum]
MSTPTTSSSKTPAASATASAVVASKATTAAPQPRPLLASPRRRCRQARQQRVASLLLDTTRDGMRNMPSETRQARSLLSKPEWVSTLRVEREFPSTTEAKSRRGNSKETRTPCLRATLTPMWVYVVHARTTRTLRARSVRAAAVEHRSLPPEP